MPIATCPELLRSPIAAFNVITLEHAEGIVSGADSVNLPVILQLSQNAIQFHQYPDAIAAAMVAVARNANVPVLLHLDHITDVSLAQRTKELGFSSLMYDGSTLDFAENVATTAQLAGWCAKNGVWLEAELGEVGGKDGAHAPGVRTDPKEAVQFVTETGVNSLAVAVGSSHAMVNKTAAIDLGLVARLREAVGVPLVLHGSSGVPDEIITQAVAAGIWKVNIGTALNIAFTGAVRNWLADNDGVDPRKYLRLARAEMAATVAHYLQVVAAGR